MTGGPNEVWSYGEQAHGILRVREGADVAARLS
jgi:hypothetical protein